MPWHLCGTVYLFRLERGVGKRGNGPHPGRALEFPAQLLEAAAALLAVAAPARSHQVLPHPLPALGQRHDMVDCQVALGAAVPAAARAHPPLSPVRAEGTVCVPLSAASCGALTRTSASRAATGYRCQWHAGGATTCPGRTAPPRQRMWHEQAAMLRNGPAQVVVPAAQPCIPAQQHRGACQGD